jgi:subtilisin family serine protease
MHTPMPRLRLAVLTTVVAVLAAAGAAGASVASAAAADGTIQHASSKTAIPGSYIVVLKDTAALRAQGVSATAGSLARSYSGKIGFTYRYALHGFSVKMTAAQARKLAANPAVAYVEADQVVHLTATQPNPPSWGLDRIDQRNLPLNNSYSYDDTAGAGVRAYIIDTGIRFSHQTFGGRATSGFDAIDGGTADDCHGHGTHVAGTVGGSQYGVAKSVSLTAVRVLNCSGSGTTAQVVAGIDFVTGNHAAGQPAVANMSLGGGANTSIDNAVVNSINDGVTYAIAAGNSNANACNFSPARVAAAITVGATDINDNRASFSNFGTCLDIFAPGVNITSAWMTSDTATNTISGTSMATPHVAGAAALFLADNPSASPATVRNALVNNATTGVVGNPGTGSPNRLLFTGAAAPPGTTVFFDNFETSLGWTTNPSGTDTATTGQWARANPEQTSSGVVLQLGTTVSGSNDLVTGPLAGASAGANDVDGGVTSIRSPAITLPSSGTITLSFSWYLAHLNNATSADFFRVRVVGTTTTTVLNQLGSATTRAGAWGSASANISGHAGQSVRILIDTADAATASLIEAGVDDVRITAS